MRISGHTPLAKMDKISIQQKTLLSSLWVESAEEFTSMMAAMEKAETVDDSIYTSLKNCETTLFDGVPNEVLAPWRVKQPGGALGCAVDPNILETFKSLGRLSLSTSSTVQISEAAMPPGVMLIDKLFPVRNQGSRGTCVAFASVGLREYLNQCEDELSEQFLYWACKQIDGWPDDAGTTIHSAMTALSRMGVCLREIWSYNPEPIENNESQDPPPSGAKESAFRFVMPYTRTVTPGFINLYKQILSGADGYGGMPIVIASLVFKSWYMSASTHQTGKITMPLPGEQPLPGGHAMLVVGYQDDPSVPGGGYFVVRNSWGKEWAARSPVAPGHALIPYAYISQYIVEAFAGQAMQGDKQEAQDENSDNKKVLTGDNAVDFEARFIRTLRQDMRNVDGKLLKSGTRVICSPESPDEVMEDSPPNRVSFQERGFAWSSKSLSRTWLPSREKWSSLFQTQFSESQNEKLHFCSTIDDNIISAEGSYAPDINPPFWCYALAWMPRVNAVSKIADLHTELITELFHQSELPKDVIPSTEWAEAMKLINGLTIYAVKSRGRIFHVVSAFISPIKFSQTHSPEQRSVGAEHIELVQHLYEKWCTDKQKPHYTFFTLGASSLWENVKGLSTSNYCLVLSWPNDEEGRWETSVPPQFASSKILRDFLDRLRPESRQQRISRIKTAVDHYISNHYEGNILLDKIAKETNYRRSNVRDAFQVMQDSGHYQCHKTSDSIAIAKTGKNGNPIKIRSHERSFVRYHLGIVGGIFIGVLGIRLAEFLRTGYFDWMALGLVLLFGYVGKCIEITLKRNQKDF